MKKLIATAVVAAAAFGAFAIETGVRFENLERGGTSVEALNTAANKVLNTENYTYWSGDVANTYNVVAMDPYSYTTRPEYFKETQTSTNALSLKTTFGKPLSFAVNGDRSTGDMGIYFDSLIKFTVCEEAPEANLYTDTGAKIALWLQEQYDEDDNITGTNLVVRAGNLSYSEALQVTQTDYVCDEVEGDFADAWHRVTIKTIADITDGDGVPGFAIYIDGELKSSSVAKWDESFTYTLSEVAKNLDDLDALFPSLKQSGDEKSTVACAQFDGTGSVNELIFTATAPSFASNEQYLDPKFTLQLGEGEPKTFRTVAAAIDAINKLTDAGDHKLTLLENLNISESLVIDNADEKITIVLDLNGKTIINSAADTTYAITVTGGTSLTITDSSANKNGMIVSVTDEDFGAIFLGKNANFRLEAGTINGYISENNASSMSFIGGSIDAASKKDAWNDEPGYKFVLNGETGFWDVVPLAYYDVTFKVDAEVYSTTNVVEETPVADIVPAAPTKTGYDFNGWGYEEGAKVTGNVEYTAQWTIKTFTVTVAPAGTNMTVVVTKNDEVVEYAASYTVNYGDDVSVVYEAEDGYELTGDATFTFEDIAENKEVTAPTATAISYSISYVLNGGDALTGVYATSYTIEDEPIKLPEATRTGYIFNGWTNETVTTATKTFTIVAEDLGPVTFYASWTENAPATPVIPAGETSVEVSADPLADEADVVAKVTIATEADQNIFTKTATYNKETGMWTVTAEIKTEVEQAVAQTAANVLNGVENAKVEVPAGLYYKITTMTSLDDTNAQTETGISNGEGISIEKPGATSGFIKIQIGTQAYAE